MNKAELIDRIAAIADVTKASTNKVLDATLETIIQALASGDSVTLPGFGVFDTNERAARDGRNPQTGEKIKIAARRVPTFRAGKNLKDSVNTKTKKKVKGE